MKLSNGLITITAIIGITLIYSRCINATMPQAQDPRGKAYAGSLTCLSCHRQVYNNYSHTGHFRTSWTVTTLPEELLGARGSLVFRDSTTVSIEKRDSGIYQVAHGKLPASKRFDIGFGSGAEAVSFGYWQDSRLFQLPLSYFSSIHGWANSPGFPMDQPYFSRPIVRRCFECHSSYVGENMENLQSLTQVKTLDRNSIVYGIDCERCHGPAADHVAFHTDNPSVKKSQYLTSWRSMTRQQRLDLCGICHSGNDLTTQKSTFSFVPGDTLSKFYYPELAATTNGSPDVHGNQLQLLAASACFQQSKGMECSSCHNVHESSSLGIEGYSKQCISCHKDIRHTDVSVKAYLDSSIIKNCIDCHMPRQASRLISFQAAGSQTAGSYLLRTHRISVYPKGSLK